jgi:hypothetical protein
MSQTTFREIEVTKGSAPGASGEQSPLSKWYAGVRDIPLSAFSVEDLCKSVRQELYPEYVVPAAIEALEKEPLAGEMYDGELTMSFRFVPKPFWRENPAIAGRFLRALKDALPRLGENLKAEASSMVAVIESVTRDP